MPLVRRIIPIGGLRAGLNTDVATIPERRIVVDSPTTGMLLATGTTAAYRGVTIESVPVGVPGSVQVAGKTTIEAGSALGRDVEVGADAQGRAVAVVAAGAYALGRTVTSATALGDIVEVEMSRRQLSVSPFFIGAGTLVGTSSAGTANVPWPPNHRAGDIGILLCETAQTSQTTPAGFTVIPNLAQGAGAGATATRLQAWWGRAASSAEPTAPLASISVDHRIGVMLGFRNCVASGNPINVSAGDVLAVAAQAIAIPGGITTIDNCLVVACIANGLDLTGEQVAFDPPFVEIFDQNNTVANGGGLAAATCLQALAGAYPAATGTLSSAFIQGRGSFALLPAT